MEQERINKAVARCMQDGYRDEANLILELTKELKIAERGYNELYKERYGDTPGQVYGHV